ncbi:MAG TPA: hypothetical protein VMD53_15565 [Rhizomicrobium sp.]|nr:hypothetical protein [Rhizomicrobium sp.]
MKAPILFSAALACLLMLAGCDSIYTDNPIGTSPETQTDTRLIGGWKFVIPPEDLKKSPGEQVFYCFFLPQKRGGFRGVMATWSTGKTSDSGDFAFEALTGKAGDHWFLNLRHIVTDGKADEDEPPGYRPYRYRIDDDGALRVFDWSPEGLRKLEADIEQGRIRGTVTIDGMGTDDNGKPVRTTNIQITADQQALDAYFAENAARIFDKPVFTLNRVADR